MKIRQHDISVSLEDGAVILEQDIGCSESAVIVLSPNQVLGIADKLRGIVRPSPEAEESRKLCVIADRLNEFVSDEAFRRALHDGQDYTDWLGKVDALEELTWEYAYGLRPGALSQSTEPVFTEQVEGAARKGEQGDLLNA